MPFLQRLVAACLIGVSGASVIVASNLTAIDGPSVHDVVVFSAATFGAFIGGWLSAPMFGKPYSAGVGSAALGALCATTTGAAIAGLILGIAGSDPGIALMAPLMVLPLILVMSPALPVWVATMALAHLALCFLRQRHPNPGKTGCP
jgi:hypothetical protein